MPLLVVWGSVGNFERPTLSACCLLIPPAFSSILPVFLFFYSGFHLFLSSPYETMILMNNTVHAISQKPIIHRMCRCVRHLASWWPKQLIMMKILGVLFLVSGEFLIQTKIVKCRYCFARVACIKVHVQPRIVKDWWHRSHVYLEWSETRTNRSCNSHLCWLNFSTTRPFNQFD